MQALQETAAIEEWKQLKAALLDDKSTFSLKSYRDAFLDQVTFVVEIVFNIVLILLCLLNA